jgi:MFS superfamily sulfate permease-like transporter
VNTEADELKHIIHSAERINGLNGSALHILEEIIEDQKTAGRQVLITGIKGQFWDAMKKGNLAKKIDTGNSFLNVQYAVDYISGNMPSSIKQMNKTINSQVSI